MTSFLGEFCYIWSVKEVALKNYILTNFKKETTSVGKSLINVLVKQQYELISETVLTGKMHEVHGYKIKPFTTDDTHASNKYPFKTIETMKQCSEYV